MSTAETEELIKFVGIDDTEEMRKVRTILENQSVQLSSAAIQAIVELFTPAQTVSSPRHTDDLLDTISYLINRFGIDRFNSAVAYYSDLVKKEGAG